MNTIQEEFQRALAYSRCRLQRCRLEHERAVDGLDTSDPNAVRSVAKLESDINQVMDDIAVLERTLGVGGEKEEAAA